MSKQVEVKVICKFCRRKFILINTYTNANIYICVKCFFQEEKKDLEKLNKQD